jgi:L-lactate dehydrogenase complex protein LldF
VKINIPLHLINMRRDIVSNRLNGRLERFVYRAWAKGLQSRLLYGAIGWLQKVDLRRRADEKGWIRRMPRIAAGWTQIRDLPAPAARSFHQLWRKRPRMAGGAL